VSPRDRKFMPSGQMAIAGSSPARGRSATTIFVLGAVAMMSLMSAARGAPRKMGDRVAE
jgi:hypothetical protein